MPLHIETPLFASRAMSLRTGRSVWLKLDALQPPGSFKIRGIGAACEAYAARGATRFVSSSGGNAGIAAAYAGRLLGIPVTVVVPETTPDVAKHLIRQEGADLVVHGASWQEANAHALERIDAGAAFIHPFDDPLIWQGHATVIDEVHRAGLRPDVVVLAVGGGGLLCGVAEGMRRNGWTGCAIVAVETQGADSLARSIAAGERIELPAITSIATSLGAKKVCERAFVWTREADVRSVVVTDDEALAACDRFRDEHRLVEPACGAALAALDAPALTGFTRILVIVCGGAVVRSGAQ
jgi:L-serine/L-threonine ammonia-lyase